MRKLFALFPLLVLITSCSTTNNTKVVTEVENKPLYVFNFTCPDTDGKEHFVRNEASEILTPIEKGLAMYRGAKKLGGDYKKCKILDDQRRVL